MALPLDRKKPRRGWWLLAAFLLLAAIGLQVPAAWVVARVWPNNPYIDQVSGTLWAGQAVGHWNSVAGTLNWRVRPQDLFWLRLGADVELLSGGSRLTAQVAKGRKQVLVQHLTGRIAAETLRAALPWQWPDAPVQVQDVTLEWQTPTGWQEASGQLNWGGGALGYPFEGRLERAVLPPLKGNVSLDRDKLHLALVDTANARMGDLYVDREQMLDVQLTQRLLLNVSGYQGQAGLDTAVVSVRQPIATLGH